MSDEYILPLTRGEEAGKKTVYIVRAAARIAVVICRNARFECLFVRHHAKGLELPGGAIEFDETPLQAGLRELYEEAGLYLPASQPMSLIDIMPVKDHRGGRWLDITYGTTVTPLQIMAQQEAELPTSWLTAEEIERQVDKQLSSYITALAFLRT